MACPAQRASAQGYVGYRRALCRIGSVDCAVNANCPDLGFAEGFEIDLPGGRWMLQGNVVRWPGPFSTGIVLFQVNNNVVVRNDVDDSFSFVASSNNVITDTSEATILELEVVLAFTSDDGARPKAFVGSSLDGRQTAEHRVRSGKTLWKSKNRLRSPSTKGLG